MSARPFLAPWVEVKYCRTVKPSLKFAVIGVSIIEPSGLAIRPLIPASCLTWAGELLAPESKYINTELKDFWSTEFPSLSSTFSVEIVSIKELATFSFALDQISITLLYFSPCVTRPDEYWDSISFTSVSALEMISSLSVGITQSSTQIEDPDFVEYSYPKYISLSANITVSFKPLCLYDMLIREDIDLLSRGLFMSSKSSSLGRIPERIALPTVVSTRFNSDSLFANLTFTFAWRSTFPLSYALWTSFMSAKIEPSPLAETFSLVM